MTGLEVAYRFFIEWGQPFIEREFPEIAHRYATGRFLGSDVLGGDDEISRDHNWGPQFDLWLSADDFALHGTRISDTLNTAAPNPWNGYRLAGGGDKSILLQSVSGWFHSLLGLSAIPQTVADWMALTETGRVWHHGDYNFVQRMSKRRDPVSVAICLGEFVTGVMRLVLLRRGDFAPYWK